MKTTFKKKWTLLYGILALIILAVNTLICFIPIFVIGLAKFIPNQRSRVYCARLIDQVIIVWGGINSSYINHFYSTQFHMTGNRKFDPNKWYLVITNHQSALDIFILQHIFQRKIPPLKFFIKEQLKWVPVFGLAWWMVGFPFMKRYSKEYLKKNPHKKGADIQTTQKALQLFKKYPSSILSFVEGTRLTPKKKQSQQSPYHHLLKPKAGGIHQVICTMGKQLQPLIDVTIVYPNSKHSLWSFLCNKIDAIYIDIREIPIPTEFTNTDNSLENSETQNEFRAWLNEQWLIKDALIKKIHKEQRIL
jgi:1-acyl-sn-glycerol-3-phosphate acyltransferase